MLNESRIHAIESIDGHLSHDEGLLLYGLARQVHSSGTIVEIGSFKGRSTAWFASGVLESGRGARVVAVDHGIGDPEAGLIPTKDIFLENMRRIGLSPVVDPIFKPSVEALREWDGTPIDVLFIDAAHDYAHVRQDIGWERHLKQGGWVVFHDGLNPADGPARVFIERIIRSGEFSSFGVVDSILFAQKIPARSFSRSIHGFVLKVLLYGWLVGTFMYRRVPKHGFFKRIARVLLKGILRPGIRAWTRRDPSRRRS